MLILSNYWPIKRIYFKTIVYYLSIAYRIDNFAYLQLKQKTERKIETKGKIKGK